MFPGKDCWENCGAATSTSPRRNELHGPISDRTRYRNIASINCSCVLLDLSVSFKPSIIVTSGMHLRIGCQGHCYARIVLLHERMISIRKESLIPKLLKYCPCTWRLQIWMKRNRLKFNCSKTVCIWKPADSSEISYLIWNWIVLLQIQLVHNLGTLLDSQFQFRKWMVAVTKGAFAVYQLQSFLEWEALIISELDCFNE